MVEDVKCAVSSLRAHADEYNIDPNRIAAMGPAPVGIFYRWLEQAIGAQALTLGTIWINPAA